MRYLIIAMYSLLVALPANAHDLDRSEFERLHKQLFAKQEATWKTIPWHLNLITAQNEAVKQKKPLFIWAMDGHPLGCT